MSRFTAPDIERMVRPGGGYILHSRAPEPPYLRSLGDALVQWAERAPARAFLAERDAYGGWRTLTYDDALRAVRGIGQALLDLGLGPHAKLLILSGNSLEHALIALGAMHVGVPVAPISPAYSLQSRDHVKLRALAGVVAPGAIFTDDKAQYAAALAALPRVPVLDRADVMRMQQQKPRSAAESAFERLTGDTIAKLLFTSGSTGVPRAVINTQRMLCANQAALAHGWPFLGKRPPVIVDWLPWSHTFGANHNFNLVLCNGGTLYIDAGKPAPGAFDTTLANLREVPSTIYFNVPRGFDMLVGHLEQDAELRATFFRNLDTMFYAAAALSPATWERLRAAAELAGRTIPMTSAWGSTETSPLVTQVCFAIDRAGVIGTPIPGTDVAFAPVGDRLEMRVRGPGVAPGYLRADGSVEPLPRDELGFYPMGDAGYLVDDLEPNAGIAFAGRTAENFKLSTGTWVHVGEVRLALIAACSPMLADAVITGEGRGEVGALVFPAPGARLDQLWPALARHAAQCGASSTRVGRVLVMHEPPSIDAGEITDKGYLNQRAILARRAADVERLYAGDPRFDHDLLVM